MTGITLRGYITNIRVFMAKGFLRSGYSVALSGEMVGFKSASHFISTFTKIEGISPKRYVKLLSSSPEFDWATAEMLDASGRGDPRLRTGYEGDQDAHIT